MTKQRVVKFDLEEFETWLAQVRPNHVMPRSSPCSCPIAQWLNNRHCHRASVNGGAVTLRWYGAPSIGQYEILPQWAVTFVRLWDTDQGCPIAETALIILRGVKERGWKPAQGVSS